MTPKKERTISIVEWRMAWEPRMTPLPQGESYPDWALFFLLDHDLLRGFTLDSYMQPRDGYLKRIIYYLNRIQPELTPAWMELLRRHVDGRYP